ncbi:transcription initiation factor TFIID subunit 4b-like isoform X1 [Asparagus officinalis]|uniref:transcription initiation factor TFIID subunit 4b-like isoform X1 n=1 Tax=Asparagus officinalis TaxID=4686 RepID=UPI00098E3CFC|nr:transcription initiation factor TFIID subunit 4b-like isoform X1 [Asparagus officinalis]
MPRGGRGGAVAVPPSDIGGDSSTFSQLSDSESGVLPQTGSSASQQLLGHWQNSSQDGNISENIQQKEEPGSQSEHPSSQTESTQQLSSAEGQDQQGSNQTKHDQPQLQLDHSHSDQQLQTETSAAQPVDKDQINSSGQTSFQIQKQESSTQYSDSQQQTIDQPLNAEQQTAAANLPFPKQESSTQHSESQQQNIQQQLNVEEQIASGSEAKRMKSSPSIPFQLLIPIVRPHLDKDRAMQLQSVFTKLRSNEVSKEDFLRVIRNIVGDQMLRQAVNKVHMQLQAQAAKNQQTSPNQYSLQNQASQQQLLSRGAQQFHDSRAFSLLPRQPVSASTVQMQMDTKFPPIENSSQKSRETEHNSDGRGMNASQMHSTSKIVSNPEREASIDSIQGINKQQQQLLQPQTSFPMYAGSSSSFHSHPYARPPISAATTALRSQHQDSQMRPSPHTQGMAPKKSGPVQPGNALNVPKYELQNIGNDAKRLHGGPLTSHSSQQLPVSWQPMASKEQRSTSIPSMSHVKQEVVDQANEPSNKSQLTTPHGSSFGSGNVGQGNPTLGALNSIGSLTTLADSNAQISSPLLAGTTTKTQLKKPSVGQKKPLEAASNSSATASKKQKTSGTFHDQSIEHLNDVTAVSGVNLREEEEQLLAAPKEDSRASEATRRVVQEEEERLILQKGPLQKKLADIMYKTGLKRISNDVERCLSLCVEERLRGVINSLIRLSKQRVDIEKTRHRFVITSDVRRHILEVNRRAKEEWDKKQAEEAEKNRKVNESDGNGSDVDKDKDDGRSKANKANKEEDDKMRTTAANVAARAAVGGDDVLSKWQLMAEQARQKREGLDAPSPSQTGKATSSKPSSGLKRSMKEQQETQRRGSSSSSISGGSRRFGRSPAAISQSKVARNISRKDIIAVLEREPQMSKSTLIYRLYEKLSGDSAVE